MFLTMEARVPCALCGYRIRCLYMNTFRINKGSMRSQGTGLAWVERNCPECGERNDHAPPTASYVPTADSQAEIDAYRAKRWPEVKAA